jgi:hypothetical protein
MSTNLTNIGFKIDFTGIDGMQHLIKMLFSLFKDNYQYIKVKKLK